MKSEQELAAERARRKTTRIANEHRYHVFKSGKNGISEDRLLELQKMSEGNPFADGLQVNKSWHSVG